MGQKQRLCIFYATLKRVTHMKSVVYYFSNNYYLMDSKISFCVWTRYLSTHALGEILAQFYQMSHSVHPERDSLDAQFFDEMRYFSVSKLSNISYTVAHIFKMSQ